MDIYQFKSQKSTLPTELRQGHKHLYGLVGSDSFKVEQFNITTEKFLTWERSPFPNVVEIWINLKGQFNFRVNAIHLTQALEQNEIYLCLPGDHQTTIEFKDQKNKTFFLIQIGRDFMKSVLPAESGNLHEIGRCLLEKDQPKKFIGSTFEMTNRIRDYVSSLNAPPVVAAARALWYQAKIQELIADVMFESRESEFFCSRQKRVTSERIAHVKRLLSNQLADPPKLQEISRLVGCSPYYLSRTFSKETGMTIPQFLREIRIERAAELLRNGDCNVTEAAFEVGYNSPSHFSQAFCQKMGVCPAMYPQSNMAKARGE